MLKKYSNLLLIIIFSFSLVACSTKYNNEAEQATNYINIDYIENPVNTEYKEDAKILSEFFKFIKDFSKQEFVTKNKAEKQLGFSINIPDEIQDLSQTKAFTIANRVLLIFYENETNQIIISKTKGIDIIDNSKQYKYIDYKDFIVYYEIDHNQLHAQWSYDNFTYAIDSDLNLSMVELKEIINYIMDKQSDVLRGTFFMFSYDDKEIPMLLCENNGPLIINNYDEINMEFTDGDFVEFTYDTINNTYPYDTIIQTIAILGDGSPSDYLYTEILQLEKNNYELINQDTYERFITNATL